MNSSTVPVEIVSLTEAAPVAFADHTAAQMAAAIQADIAAYERTSREAVFIALRIGLRLIWIRDNSPHGSLTQFTEAHFAGKSRTTLYKYIGLADLFLQESGLQDKTTHKLTGKALEAATPIVEEQLAHFTDPQAKPTGAVKKVIAWVGRRGLSEIYTTLETQRRGVTHRPPPPPTARHRGQWAELQRRSCRGCASRP